MTGETQARNGKPNQNTKRRSIMRHGIERRKARPPRSGLVQLVIMLTGAGMISPARV
jgi:hypothetical protein